MSSQGSVSTSLQAAYILHYTPWRDTSFIVEVFTLTHGRLAMVARGARASKAGTRALYQPFRPLLVSWVGRGDLRTLTAIEESGPQATLHGAELACGYYINELVLRLLGKDQPQPTVFAHYTMALAELELPGVDIEIVLRTFELQLLEQLGVLPDLACCTPVGLPIEPSTHYHYHPANAVAIPRSVDPALGIQKHRTLMSSGDTRDPSIHPDGLTPDAGIPISGKTLLAMAELDFSSRSVRDEAKQLLRAVLRIQLGDRPLRSREMFKSLVQNTDESP